MFGAYACNGLRQVVPQDMGCRYRSPAGCHGLAGCPHPCSKSHRGAHRRWASANPARLGRRIRGCGLAEGGDVPVAGRDGAVRCIPHQSACLGVTGHGPAGVAGRDHAPPFVARQRLPPSPAVLLPACHGSCCITRGEPPCPSAPNPVVADQAADRVTVARAPRPSRN